MGLHPETFDSDVVIFKKSYMSQILKLQLEMYVKT